MVTVIKESGSGNGFFGIANYVQVVRDEYIEDLDIFDGGMMEYYSGYYDDYKNIKSLIKSVGLLVINEETQAKVKRKEADATNDEDNFYSEEVYDETQCYFSYRQYTYKSLFFLVHTIFENRVVQLCKIIHEHKGDKAGKDKPIKLPKLEAAFSLYIKYLESHLGKDSIDEMFKDRKHYSEIRNALHHRDGLTSSNDTIKWIEGIEGIKTEPHKKHSEAMINIDNSAFILLYLENIFAGLKGLRAKADMLNKQVN